MVKLEDDGSSIENTCANSSFGAGSELKPRPRPQPAMVKEESLPSSPSSHCKSYLVGMGFSTTLVDKVIKENGEGDANILLEALLAQPADSRASLDLETGFTSPKKESDNSPLEFSSDDVHDNKDDEAGSHANMEKKTYLLMMDFTEEEADLAIDRLGDNSTMGELVDFIIASQIARSCGDKDMCGSINDGNENEASTTEALFGTMDKTLCLLRMGFTENEVSSAITNFGSDAPLDKLADSILTCRLTSQVKEEDFSNDGIYFSPQEQNEFEQLGLASGECPAEIFHHKEPWRDDYEDKGGLKKAKFACSDEAGTSSDWRQWRSTRKYECPPDRLDRAAERPELFPSMNDDSLKMESPNYKPLNLGGNTRNSDTRSPYFFFGNVADVSQDTWHKLSQFLNGTEPEFVNSQFFSGFIRKEGYLHNLSTAGRFHIIPKPPMTIEDSLPHTKKWWPSWDTRKQLSCINSETVGVSQLCDRLGRMMGASNGMLSKEQQTDVLHHCKSMNLIWIGPNKLCPIEPEQLEQLLGYPRHHTGGMELSDRLNALKNSFQTDTIGYHLSVLKSLYPNGLRLLSIYSGVGGAEVALHRLGVRLKCVVSIESSENGRRILKQWWKQSGQTGEFRQIASAEKLSIRQIEGLVREFGGFDIVIGSNPGCHGLSLGGSSSRDGLVGLDLNQFYEFTRVLQRVRSVMGRHPPSTAGKGN